MPETPPEILGTGAAAAVSFAPEPENPGEMSGQGTGALDQEFVAMIELQRPRLPEVQVHLPYLTTSSRNGWRAHCANRTPSGL